MCTKYNRWFVGQVVFLAVWALGVLEKAFVKYHPFEILSNANWSIHNK